MQNAVRLCIIFVFIIYNFNINEFSERKINDSSACNGSVMCYSTTWVSDLYALFANISFFFAVFKVYAVENMQQIKVCYVTKVILRWLYGLEIKITNLCLSLESLDSSEHQV
jgi:hypothetical protein